MILQGISPADIRAITQLVARILEDYPNRDVISTWILENRILERSPEWYIRRSRILQTNLLVNAMEENGWGPWNPPRRNHRITAWVRLKGRLRQPMVVGRRN